MQASNPSKFSVRPAQTDDLPGIQTIFNHEIKHSTAVYSYSPYSDIEIQEWFQLKIEQNFPVIVAVNEVGRVIGFATYGKFRERSAYQFTAEHSVYVHSEFRKLGVATELLLMIIQLAKENGLHSLIAGIDAENVTSIQFHLKHGFQKVGLIKEAGYKFEKWLDLQFMQLILT